MTENLFTQVQAKAAELGFPFTTPEGIWALCYLLTARDETQHRRGAAEIVRLLYGVLRRDDTGERPNPEELYSLVVRAPQRGRGTKAARDQQALDDAWMFCIRGDFNTHAAALAKIERITLAAARKRVAKAERLTGIQLDRRGAFGRSSRRKDQ